MAEDIDIAVRVTGADDGARDMDELADKTKDAEKATSDLDRATREIAQKLGQLSGAIATVGRAIGSESVGMLGGLVGSVAQFAQMGAMLGPGGAVVGGLAGATAGLIGVAGAASRAREELADLNTATVSAMSGIAHAIAGEDETAWSGAMAAAQEQIVALEAQARELRATAASTLTGLLDPNAAALARIELGRVEDQILALRGSISRLSEEAAASPLVPSAGGRGMYAYLDMDPALARRTAEHDDEPERRGSRAPDDSAERARASAEAYDDFVRSVAEAENRATELRAAGDAERAAAHDAELERIMEFQASELEAAKEQAAALLDLEQEKQDAMAEMNSERIEQAARNEDEARQNAIAQQEEFMQLGMNVVSLMTDALGDIASGEKTAAEAFKGLAKSFLQMISQYAALKAATEFADAIAAFARQDYASGPQHLAAGVAFTAVAVATGVGAAAITTAKPSAPARPEADRNAGSGKNGGGDVIINWNSPVVTAGTRDDLGRELGALVRAGDARYGAA